MTEKATDLCCTYVTPVVLATGLKTVCQQNHLINILGAKFWRRAVRRTLDIPPYLLFLDVAGSPIGWVGGGGELQFIISSVSIIFSFTMYALILSGILHLRKDSFRVYSI
jgi:hypothetical protein